MKPWRSADPHSLLSPCLAHKLHQLYIHRSVLLRCSSCNWFMAVWILVWYPCFRLYFSCNTVIRDVVKSVRHGWSNPSTSPCICVYPTTALLLSGAVSLLEYFEFMVLCWLHFRWKHFTIMPLLIPVVSSTVLTDKMPTPDQCQSLNKTCDMLLLALNVWVTDYFIEVIRLE